VTTKIVRGLVLSVLLAATAAGPVRAADVWHQGQIMYKHSTAPVVHGEIPEGMHLLLDDGTDIDVSAITSDDVFQKLVSYWSRERTDYRAAPPFVDRFMFKVRDLDPRTGLRNIELSYTANDTYGHRWKGQTHFLK
jgi:hypothetical protein